MYKELEMQAFNRDQDAQGVYMYNDFTLMASMKWLTIG